MPVDKKKAAKKPKQKSLGGPSSKIRIDKVKEQLNAAKKKRKQKK